MSSKKVTKMVIFCVFSFQLHIQHKKQYGPAESCFSSLPLHYQLKNKIELLLLIFLFFLYIFTNSVKNKLIWCIYLFFMSFLCVFRYSGKNAITLWVGLFFLLQTAKKQNWASIKILKDLSFHSIFTISTKNKTELMYFLFLFFSSLQIIMLL